MRGGEARLSGFDRSPEAGRSRPFIGAALAVLAITALVLALLPRPLTPDVAGQLWIADQLRDGVRLYRDISEPNPPLWFWLAMPAAFLAEWLGMRADGVLILAVGGAALLSVWTVSRLLAIRQCRPSLAVLGYAALILLVMPSRDFGQREQLALIWTLPYIVLIALRREAQSVPLWLAVLVGVQGATGFALKHYFVAVPVLLECWLAYGVRRQWRPVRPETLALAVGALAYAAAIALLTPEFLTVSLPETTLAYGAATVPEWRYMLRPAQPIWVLIIIAIVLRRRADQEPLPATVVALLVAAGGYGAAWLLQHKGWPYHGIPITGLLALALALLLARHRRSMGPLQLFGLAMPVLLFALPTQWQPDAQTDIAPAFAGLRPGEPVAVLAREGWTSWPNLADGQFRIVGRGGALWILQAVDGNADEARDPRIAALGRDLVRQTAAAFRCDPPRRIVFYPGAAAHTVTAAADNPLGYFGSEPAFAAVLSHYRRLPLPGRFDAFTLVRPLPPQPVACRAAHQARRKAGAARSGSPNLKDRWATSLP
jgi:hypothetical protein